MRYQQENGLFARTKTLISSQHICQSIIAYHAQLYSNSLSVLDAVQNLGLPFIEDMNSSSSPILGAGKCQFTIDGQAHRNSSYHAFLPREIAVTRKSRLTICTETIVTRLDLKSGRDGAVQADGVYLHSSKIKSSSAYVSARREIILCGGPLSNPQILQLRFAKNVNPFPFTNQRLPVALVLAIFLNLSVYLS